MKPKNNKYLYGFKILVDYGQGYEYEIFETNYKDAMRQLKDYRNNCNYPVVCRRGREMNPDYKPLN